MQIQVSDRHLHFVAIELFVDRYTVRKYCPEIYKDRLSKSRCLITALSLLVCFVKSYEITCVLIDTLSGNTVQKYTRIGCLSPGA
jgi:hypothetical protein